MQIFFNLTQTQYNYLNRVLERDKEGFYESGSCKHLEIIIFSPTLWTANRDLRISHFLALHMLLEYTTKKLNKISKIN